MAGEQNVIQVVIESVNKMSQDLTRIDADMNKLRGTTDQYGRTTTVAADRSIKLNQALLPLTRAVGTVSNAAAKLNPEIGILVSNMDNLAFAAVRAASRSQTTGAAILAAFRAVFNPATLLVIGAVTALSHFISKMIESREQAEKLNVAFRLGNVGAFSSVIAELEIKLDKAVQRMVEAQNALRAPNLPREPITPTEKAIAGKTITSPELEAARRDLANLEKQRADLETKERELREREFNREFPILEKNLQAQLMMNKTLDERINIMVDLQTAQLRAKGASEDAVKALLPDITRLETLKQLKVEAERHADFTKEMVRIEEEEYFSYRDIQAALVKTDQEAFEERTKLLEEFNEKRREEFEKMMDQDVAELVRGPEEIFKLTKKAEEEAEKAADEYAKTFADRLVSAMEGEKVNIQGIFRSIGRLIVVSLLEEAFRALLISPLKQIFTSLALSGDKQSGSGGFLGLFRNIFSLFGLSGGGGGGGGGSGIIAPGLKPPFLTAAHGGIFPGNFIPVNALRRFQTGGMVGGPTLGVIGEEGPEIVARMKPARPGDMGGGDIVQKLYLVDQRPPRLGPRDVVLYVTADMNSGGDSMRAVQNVIKRT